MSLASPYVNSVTFKDLGGTYPNRYNTLHSERKQGGNTVFNYCQPFPNGHTIILQFISESLDDVSLKIYNPTLNATVTNSYVASITGDVTRYWFNFEIELTSDYHNKKVYFEAVQGADTLTSEPIIVSDITEEINRGEIIFIAYTNNDRNNSDIDNRFVNWGALTSTDKEMNFFVEGILIQPNDTDDVELLKGVQQPNIVSSVYYSGNILQVERIPDYLATKIGLITSLDEYSINGISYAKPDSIEIENAEGSTFQKVSVSLIEKLSIGLNVDNLDQQNTDTMEWHAEDTRESQSSSYEVTEPDKYYTSLLTVQQQGSPATSPITITLGYGGAGTSDIGRFDIYSGQLNNIPFSIRNSFTSASTIYVGIPAVAGNSMKLSFNFQLADLS